MRRIVFVLLLLIALPAAAQEAVPRGEPSTQGSEPSGPIRQAVPRGSRPQGDNPRVGTAVPRTGRRPAARPDSRPLPPSARDRRSTIIVRPPAVRHRYDYPYYRNRLYPFGYGAFGLGYFYYDPYRWSTFPGYSTYPGYGSSYQPYNSLDRGEIRLEVTPRTAQVFVDGYYAGVVDDFDGAFQALKLSAGPYRMDFVAPGYETLSIDVRITPGQKISYRGELQRVGW